MYGQVRVLVQAFARFVHEGLGTPAPVAPTETLVVGGLYRYVRNPMYLAVLATILGQALLLGQPVLFGYAFVVWLAFASFVRFYEEPHLTQRFGQSYRAYRARRAGVGSACATAVLPERVVQTKFGMDRDSRVREGESNPHVLSGTGS